MHGSSTLASLNLALWLVACSGPLDSASAYDNEDYLCGTEEAEARTEECLTAEDCTGWVSFRGTLQDQAVTVDSDLISADLDLVNVPDLGLVRDSISLSADSPYFTLRWVFSELPALRTTDGDIESPVSVLDESGSINASLRLQGGGASVELQGRKGVLRTRWTLTEHWGQAQLDFGSSNTIDGCFFARTSVESE